MNKELQDLAWSVLPKEFKEEVKELYRHENKVLVPIDGVTTLNDIFGKHNLTSDAEGEEMLTVEADLVRELYQRAKEIEEESKRIHSPMVAAKYHGVQSVIEDLFGSKCLPDEKPKSCGELLDKMIDIADEIIDKIEPKPTEPKLKYNVGDEVKCKLDGEAHKIAFIDKGPTALPYRLENDMWASESDLEPYTELEEVAKMKPIESEINVYLATKEEEEEFRLLLHENGFKWNTDRSLISLSCWSSALEEDKIHNVYPDKTVTYYGKKTSDTLTFSEFKKQYFEGNVNHRQFIANCDKEFDNILKDSLSKERRLNIATQMIKAIMQCPEIVERIASAEADSLLDDILHDALYLTDRLMSECEKGGSK